MKIQIELKIKPFKVPNYVLVEQPPYPREEGLVEPQKFHLSELDSYALEEMCKEFTDSVFLKAGKGRPPQEAE